MERNKASVIIIFLLAGFFIIGLAMVLNTSARRTAFLNRQNAIDKRIEALNNLDLTIYWIGDVPAELEKLKESMVILKPEEISRTNMPVKTNTFRIVITDPEDDTGRPTLPPTEIPPHRYSDYLLIVINSVEGFDDDAKDILHNCIVDNGVPVLSVGGPSCDLAGTILIHGAGYSRDYSMLYKLKEGYNEPYLDAKAVEAGGMDFADEISAKLATYFDAAVKQKYAEASERWSAAISSSNEAATATTEDSESTENSTSETKPKILVKP